MSQVSSRRKLWSMSEVWSVTSREETHGLAKYLRYHEQLVQRIDWHRTEDDPAEPIHFWSMEGAVGTIR